MREFSRFVLVALGACGSVALGAAACGGRPRPSAGPSTYADAGAYVMTGPQVSPADPPEGAKRGYLGWPTVAAANAIRRAAPLIFKCVAPFVRRIRLHIDTRLPLRPADAAVTPEPHFELRRVEPDLPPVERSCIQSTLHRVAVPQVSPYPFNLSIEREE